MYEMSEKKVKWVAITGIMGSGKSSVIQYLKSVNYQVLDCDEIAHDCLNTGEIAYEQVLHFFSTTILNEDKTINRRKLAQFIFNDEVNKAKLETIVHPQVLAKLNELKQQCTDPLLFVEVPLLYECGWEDKFDEVWVVFSPYQDIIARLIEKRGMTLQQIEERLNHQIPLNEKMMKADVVLMNDQGLDQLIRQINIRLKEGYHE